jgi:hypothetical protein
MKIGLRTTPPALAGADEGPDLNREVAVRSYAAPVANLLALALGVAAVGAVAIGAFAISRLAVDRVAIKSARFGKLDVDELTVRKLYVENSEPAR